MQYVALFLAFSHSYSVIIQRLPFKTFPLLSVTFLKLTTICWMRQHHISQHLLTARFSLAILAEILENILKWMNYESSYGGIPLYMTSQRRWRCIWRTNDQSMHNITFVNKANFVKVYNDFVLKWLIFALYVVVVPEQILLGSIWRTL
jgi:hypothetical protein